MDGDKDLIVSSQDDSTENLDPPEEFSSYGTFQTEEADSMDGSQPHMEKPNTDRCESGDDNKKLVVTGRYRKRHESAPKAKRNNRNVDGDAMTQEEGNTSIASGDDVENHDNGGSDDTRRDDPANVTTETMLSDEDRETDSSIQSGASTSEQTTEAVKGQSANTLHITINMTQTANNNKQVPPEMIVLKKFKNQEDVSCYDVTRTAQGNSVNQDHTNISYPTDFTRQESFFSVKSERDRVDTEEWEWIESAPTADETDEPGTGIYIHPFACTHFEPLSFRDVRRSVFLPHQKLQVTVVDCGRSSSSQFLNPNLYFIEVTHGACQWTIQRRSNDFLKLHEIMLLYKARLVIPIGDRSHLERRRIFLAHTDLAHFPRTPDALVSGQRLPKRMNQYEVYLKSLVSNPTYRNHPQALEFLEVSHLSFVDELGEKGKEGWVQKRSGGHRVPITRCCPCLVCTDCTSVAAHYSKRWLICKDSFMTYVRPSDGHIRSVLLADQDFDVKWGVEETGIEKGLLISNQYRKLLVKCDTIPMARQWMIEIMELISKSEYKDDHRFEAFGPERTDTYAKWYVDGSTYFSDLADSLEEADQEIFITDWWLCAEIYLKRPAVEGPYWRLDNILLRKAMKGVKVFILLYKEIDVTIELGSKHTKHLLMDLHPNIKVMRHPDHNLGQVFLWAHHEKLVAIDQRIAFVGGLDICYGRWDDFKHRLTDVGSALVADATPPLPKQLAVSPISTPEPSPVLSSLDDESGGYFRRPRLKSAATYLKRPIRRLKQDEFKTSVDENLEKLGLTGTSKLWIGKDYCNFIAKDVMAPQEALQDSVDRMKTPRMPWHDIGTMVYGKAAADVARHFIQRWNFTKKEKAEKLNHYPLLLPKSTSSIEIKPEHKSKSTPCNCQLLRSASRWSVGIKNTENSIQRAYIRLILDAKHYIYIENQFFISIHGINDVTNGIAQALYLRIIKAHENNETFRVYVVLPLLPAFEGNVGESGGGAIHTILHWEYQSICRGEHSLLERLKRAGISNHRKYITFYGLRTHDTLGAELVTELVYIHSKLMIVDDRSIICGSANINDRSLAGKRDSELAVLVEDTEMVETKMNGERYMAGKLAFGLREWLFNEHLGVLQGHGKVNVIDPVSKKFYEGTFMNIAAKNTAIYEQVFRCLPTDKVTSSAELQEYKKKDPMWKTDRKRATNVLRGIHGNLTQMPLNFLKNENLQPKLTTQEGIAPTRLWT